MRIAVITIVSGRQDHLRRQHAALETSGIRPDIYVVVSMGDGALISWAPKSAVTPLIEKIPTDGVALPLAAARNRGALGAISQSADLLIFLDVDCIPSRDLISLYRAASTSHPFALLSGAVGYLPEKCDFTDPDSFERIAHFHDFRKRLEWGRVEAADPRLFWSLSFAVRVGTWERIGGFCEDYLGYGGEDTDFAFLAADAGIEFLWVGGAEAFHQYHPTADPPIDHVDDILCNGALFNRRWGFWPMEGWLRQFAALGLTERDEKTGDWMRRERRT